MRPSSKKELSVAKLSPKTTGKAKAKSHFLCVYFGLSKGEGVLPQYSDLSPKELSNPGSMCEFILNLDEGGSSIDPDLIKSCRVIYDGVKPLVGAFRKGSPPYGVVVDSKAQSISFKLRPIIEFELALEVDPDEFRRLVWGSTYSVLPVSFDEPFYAEDWNGYTEVLCLQAKQEWIERLKKRGAYSGKVFNPLDLKVGVGANKLS